MTDALAKYGSRGSWRFSWTNGCKTTKFVIIVVQQQSVAKTRSDFVCKLIFLKHLNQLAQFLAHSNIILSRTCHNSTLFPLNLQYFTHSEKQYLQPAQDNRWWYVQKTDRHIKCMSNKTNRTHFLFHYIPTMINHTSNLGLPQHCVHYVLYYCCCCCCYYHQHNYRNY